MKRSIRIALGAVMAAALFMGGCMPASADRSVQSGNPQGQAPAGTEGTMGIVTEAGSDSVTIAVMPQGSAPQGGGNGAQGPSGTGRPESGGQQPTPGGSAAPGGNPGGAPGTAMAAPDTSGWEKKTYRIDGSTKIVQMQGPGSGSSQETALTAGDLKAGDSVSVTERPGQSGTADRIAVMQGMGGQGMPGPNGAGAQTAASGNT